MRGPASLERARARASACARPAARRRRGTAQHQRKQHVIDVAVHGAGTCWEPRAGRARDPLAGRESTPIMKAMIVAAGSMRDLRALATREQFPEHSLAGRLLWSSQKKPGRLSTPPHSVGQVERPANATPVRSGTPPPREVRPPSPTTSASPKRTLQLAVEEETTPSWFLRAIHALATCVAIGSATTIPTLYAKRAGMAEPNELLYLAGAVIASAMWAPVVMVTTSAGRALQPDGALEQLVGAAQTASHTEATSLQRWRVGLALVFGLLVVIVQVLCFGSLLPAADTVWEAVFAVSMAILAPLGYPCPMVWWSSMRLSSCVCRDEATEVIRAIADFDLGDSRDKCSTWHETVVRPALRLDKRLRVLSAGWGDGFA